MFASDFFTDLHSPSSQATGFVEMEWTQNPCLETMYIPLTERFANHARCKVNCCYIADQKDIRTDTSGCRFVVLHVNPNFTEDLLICSEKPIISQHVVWMTV